MIDATYLKAHRMASSLRLKKGAWTTDRTHTKRHEHKAACHEQYQWLSARFLHNRCTDQRLYRRRLLRNDLSKAQWMLANREYDADWFRGALRQKGIKPCIPKRKTRSLSVTYDKCRYKRRNRIEIMFGRLKVWQRVATRYDRCPTAFFSALALVQAQYSGCDQQGLSLRFPSIFDSLPHHC